jgi:GT2 family glycosyltransferase
MARGKYIITLNPDTQLSGGTIVKLMSVLKANGQAGVVAPQLLNPDGTVQPSCRRFPHRRDVIFEISGLSRLFSKSARFNGWKMGDFDHCEQRSVEQPQGACLMFRSDLLDHVGFWDASFPMFFSDVDWCHRVKLAGYDIVFYPDAKVVHQRGVSIHQRRPAMIWSSHESFYQYLRKYRASGRFFLANEIVGIILGMVALIRIAFAFVHIPKTG